MRLNTQQQYRLCGTLALIISALLATYFVILALKQNVNFFFSPQELSTLKPKLGTRVRIGGMVKKQSVIRKEGLKLEFVVTDFQQDLKVQYTGVVPDLFKEGQGVVVSGIFENPRLLIADEILAKHDERYMPMPIPITKPKHQRGAGL